MTSTDNQNNQDNEQAQPKRIATVWSWLPTMEGALRREAVISFVVERFDGPFKGGYTSVWSIKVKTTIDGEAIQLRPDFFDPVELCIWVDLVFPGSAFELLPPSIITDAPQFKAASEDQGVRYLMNQKTSLAKAIRDIGDGLAGGNAYEPFQGYRPPPGAPPVAG